MRPKETKGKRKIHLVNPTLVTEVAKVREFGVEKYGDEKGWRLTPDIDYLDAAARHVLAAIEAVQQENFDALYDKESGLSHFAHAACDLMFIIQRMDEHCKASACQVGYFEEFKGDHLDDCTTL